MLKATMKPLKILKPQPKIKPLKSVAQLSKQTGLSNSLKRTVSTTCSTPSLVRKSAVLMLVISVRRRASKT